MIPGDVKRRISDLGFPGSCALADPAMGDTPSRWRTLFDLAARNNVSLVRLIEAHVDAVAIMHEAGHEPVPGALYGVWASIGPTGPGVRLEPGSRVLSGSKSFCSGCGVVDRALIDVDCDGGRRLIDVDMATTASIRYLYNWNTPAMAATWTATVELSNHRVGDEAFVGVPGWYLDRVGFWHGACGPAACWAGAAAGLADSDWGDGSDPYRRAHHGAVIADVWTMSAVLDVAGREADGRPNDLEAAKRRALTVRHAIHELAIGIVDRHGRSLGPRPFVESSAVAQRAADTQLYLRQFHGDRDLAALAEATRSFRDGPP